MNIHYINSDRATKRDLGHWLRDNGVSPSNWDITTGDINDLIEEMRDGKTKLDFYMGQPCRKVRAINVCIYRWVGADLLVLANPRDPLRPELATLKACGSWSKNPSSGAQIMLTERFPDIAAGAAQLELFSTESTPWKSPRFPGMAWYANISRFCWELPAFLLNSIKTDNPPRLFWLRETGLEWVKVDPIHDALLDRYAHARRNPVAAPQPPA